MNIVGKSVTAGLLLAAAAGVLAGGVTFGTSDAEARSWKHRWKAGPARMKWRRHHVRRQQRPAHARWRRGHKATWGNRNRRTWVRRGHGRATGVHVRRGPFANHVAARHMRRVGPGRWATAGGYANTRGGGLLYRGQARRIRGGVVEQGQWAARNGDRGVYQRVLRRTGAGWQRSLTVTNHRGQTVSLGRGWRREADGSRTWEVHGQGADGREGGLRWNSRTGWSRY